MAATTSAASEAKNADEEGELEDEDEEQMQTADLAAAKSSSGGENAPEELIRLNSGAKECILLDVFNSSSQAITVGSHLAFIEANKALQFDRALANGLRLNIPSGDSVRFEPNATKVVPLIAIAGQRLVRGTNNLVDGEVGGEDGAALKRTMKRVGKRGFGNRPRKSIETADIEAVNKEFGLNLPASWCVQMPREVYWRRYGPTVGDRIHLADLGLVIQIERDFINYGDELTFGIGKVTLRLSDSFLIRPNKFYSYIALFRVKTLREGQGQAVAARNDVALDTILTNVVIVDAVAGVLKADVGIKDGMIQGVGKAGNPHTMEVTPGLVVGVGTDVICGEGLIVTAGGVDMGACFAQSKDSLMAALGSGLTTLLGGGTGSLSSGRLLSLPSNASNQSYSLI